MTRPQGEKAVQNIQERRERQKDLYVCGRARFYHLPLIVRVQV